MTSRGETTTKQAAIVTGGSSGIGEATALLLAERGFDVGLTYSRNEGGAREVADEIARRGRAAVIARLDLAAPGDVDATMNELVGKLGRVDVLVNNAGANRRMDCIEETVDGWNQTLAVNLVGPWACARHVAEHMIERRHAGRIINISSILATEPLGGGGAYCASKAGLELLTKVMALEWAEHGILVNSVAPGHTATPMNFAPEELDGSVLDRPVIPIPRAASSEEVAAAVAFLAAREASYITGASILVDGGLRLASGPQSLQDATGLPPSRPNAR